MQLFGNYIDVHVIVKKDDDISFIPPTDLHLYIHKIHVQDTD
jgi:hypothetical protein